MARELSEYRRLVQVKVDVQNDFCPGGTLAVKEGDHVVPPLNLVSAAIRKYVQGRVGAYCDVRKNGWDQAGATALLIATGDWHPPVTDHFGSPPDYKTTWPVHCLAGQPGAAFHKDLDLTGAIVLKKGTEPDEDAYSGFQGHDEDGRGLIELIGEPPEDVVNIIGGLATDHCILATALDSRRYGYDTFVLSDAVRGVDPDSTDLAMSEMQDAGVQFISSSAVLQALGLTL